MAAGGVPGAERERTMGSTGRKVFDDAFLVIFRRLIRALVGQFVTRLVGPRFRGRPLARSGALRQIKPAPIDPAQCQPAEPGI
jgi:hypothetical protein